MQRRLASYHAHPSIAMNALHNVPADILRMVLVARENGLPRFADLLQ